MRPYNSSVQTGRAGAFGGMEAMCVPVAFPHTLPPSLVYYLIYVRCCVFSARKEDITTRNCRTRAALLFVLGQPALRASFLAFCKSQHSEENIMCWIDISAFKNVDVGDASGLKAAANAIVRKASGAARGVMCWDVCSAPFGRHAHLK